jgi:hypothetical protein
MRSQASAAPDDDFAEALDGMAGDEMETGPPPAPEAGYVCASYAQMLVSGTPHRRLLTPASSVRPGLGARRTRGLGSPLCETVIAETPGLLR